MKVIIQDEISVEKEWVDKQIEKYKNLKKFKIGILSGTYTGPQIAVEITMMSSIGKAILMMVWRYEQSPYFIKDDKHTTQKDIKDDKS